VLAETDGVRLGVVQVADEVDGLARAEGDALLIEAAAGDVDGGGERRVVLRLAGAALWLAVRAVVALGVVVRTRGKQGGEREQEDDGQQAEEWTGTDVSACVGVRGESFRGWSLRDFLAV
jgi:hypothetical protein